MLICVGKILKPFGQKGEVNVLPYTDNIERFKDLDKVLLKKGNHSLIRSILEVKIYHKKLIIRFEGSENRENAMGLNGMEIMIREEERIVPPEGSFFIDEIIGMVVIFEEQIIGNVEGILNESGDNPLIRVRRENEYFHVPFIKQFIHEITEDRIILSENSRELLSL